MRTERKSAHIYTKKLARLNVLVRHQRHMTHTKEDSFICAEVDKCIAMICVQRYSRSQFETFVIAGRRHPGRKPPISQQSIMRHCRCCTTPNNIDSVNEYNVHTIVYCFYATQLQMNTAQEDRVEAIVTKTTAPHFMCIYKSIRHASRTGGAKISMFTWRCVFLLLLFFMFVISVWMTFLLRIVMIWFSIWSILTQTGRF